MVNSEKSWSGRGRIAKIGGHRAICTEIGSQSHFSFHIYTYMHSQKVRDESNQDGVQVFFHRAELLT